MSLVSLCRSAGEDVLENKELQPVQDTTAAFKMHQADFLKRKVAPEADRKDSQ